MNAGEIGTEAGRIFEYNLPSSWIFRSQEDQNDFGIDAEVELKDSDGKALGKESVFKVQIKGEENSSFIHGGKTLSFTLKMDRLKYYFEFKVPVVLVVVEVSSERIFWLPLTNNDVLRKKSFESNANESIQIHMPIQNTIVRKKDELANKIIVAVIDCWDYLNIKGLKDSVTRYPAVSPSQLAQKIEDIGDVLFKAYHQKLNNLLFEKNFKVLYQQATEMCLSPIIPTKDRFLAMLYYFQAFQIAPYTEIRREVYEENFKICHWLINLAREKKCRNHRHIAIGKCRRIKFKTQLDQLHATHHSIHNFKNGSFEHLMFNNQTQEMYRDCCLSLQKLIELFNRHTRDSQYHILSDLFIDISPLILIFMSIHKERGTEESIEFLERWHKGMSLLIMSYCVIAKDTFKIKRLYFFFSTQLKNDTSATKESRELILLKLPELEATLNDIEQSVLEEGNHRSFYDLTIKEQKFYFRDVAKNLGMDPDDPESEFGHIVDMGLKNFDPTNIMRNCESLFVHYRPGGMIAQSLGMHSAGGMHLLVCLKHGHAQGTGNLLTRLYDNSDSPDLGHSFKQNNCDKCTDCKPRTENWTWSLKWYESAIEENKELLSKYKF
jgi:hypothetical protein